MAKSPKDDLDALNERVSKLEQAVAKLDSEAIKEDETVTIRRTCHIAKLKAVGVSSKRAKTGASAISKLKKMGK